MSDTQNSQTDRRKALAGDDHAGWRLDRFLAAALPDFSRSRLQQLLENEAVSLGQKGQQSRTIKDANHRVKPGETYTVTVPPTAPAIPQGQDIPLEVIYEDKDLIVINKPAGLVVHPAAGNPDGTLVNALIAHCGAGMLSIGGEARPGIVHRLDKDTSRPAGGGQDRTRHGQPGQAVRQSHHRTRLQCRGVGRPARRSRPDRKPDRAQPLRPQAHGGAARRRQTGRARATR